jgi:hypothetical protein
LCQLPYQHPRLQQSEQQYLRAWAAPITAKGRLT